MMSIWCFQSPLAEAVRRRNLHELRALVAQRPVSQFPQEYLEGLMTACQLGWAGMARVLLAAGADPNAGVWALWGYPLHRGLSDSPLLQAACRTPELVALLLAHGADPNQASEVKTPLMEAAAYGKSTQMARLLLEAGAEVNAVDHNGWSALHHTAGWGSCRALELLLEHGAEVNRQSNSGSTPLLLAARWGCGAQVRTLLRHGADPMLCDNKGISPLEYAITNGFYRAAKALLEGGVPVDNGQRDPLGIALSRRWILHRRRVNRARFVMVRARCNRTNMVRLLLEHGASANAWMRHGLSPLHLAAWNGWDDVAAVLLEHGAELEVEDEELRTPLHLAVRRGRLRTARLLLEHAAYPDFRELGAKLLDLAARHGHVDMCALLLEFGAGEALPCPPARGWAALESAVERGHAPVVRFLLSRGFGVETGSYPGHTPLMAAVRCGHRELAQLLLEHGACATPADEQGVAVARSALEAPQPEAMLKLLFEHGVSVETRDEDGCTLLMHAARNGRLQALRYLLECGAAVEVVDAQGWSPLLLALAWGEVEAARLLVAQGASLAGASAHMLRRARRYARVNRCAEAQALLDELTPSCHHPEPPRQ